MIEPKILEQIEQDGQRITRFTRDGVNISHEIVESIIIPKIEIEPQPTVEDRLEAIEQTSAYTQIQVEYLATLAEINNGL